jgi:hypothetical protein
LSAYIAYNPELRDLELLYDALYLKPTRLLITKVAIRQSDLIEALINRGLQLNLLSALLAKEQNLIV